MSASVNTETPTYGKYSPNFLITSLLLPLSRTKFSASTVVFLPALTPSTRSVNSIASRRFPMKDQFAISSGLTLMIAAVGVSPLVVLATHSVKTSQRSSTTITAWLALPALISWWWMATIGPTSATLWLCSVPLTTAIDAEMRPPLWKSTNSWTAICKSPPTF